MEDLVIFGGLVPSLIIDQEALPSEVAPHVGTMDLDVGLQLALLNEGRYRQLTERLRDAGFAMDTNDAGNLTRQRWAITSSGTVTVDFLIQPSRPGDKGGKLRDIEADFAAIIAPGLRCAFRDHLQVTIKSTTLFGEKATRGRVRSCSRRSHSTAGARTRTPTTSITSFGTTASARLTSPPSCAPSSTMRFQIGLYGLGSQP